MNILWLVLLMFAAYVGALWWRKKITKRHTAFKTKMDLAGDNNQAETQIQAYYQKKSYQQLQQRRKVSDENKKPAEDKREE